ncbi:MAG: RidA family protein [Planctomycetota bacterium]
MIILQPNGWPRPKGYSNGIEAHGRQIYTAGVIGWNEREEFETDDFAGQVRQCLLNIRAILKEAGAEPEHLVRLTWYITDKKAYLDSLEGVGAAYRDVLGKVFPTMAVVQVAGLLEDRAQVEIEATAVVPEPNA